MGGDPREAWFPGEAGAPGARQKLRTLTELNFYYESFRKLFRTEVVTNPVAPRASHF